MNQVCEDPEAEAVLLIDVTNAFNCMNRAVALHVPQIGAPMVQYLKNTYCQPVNL